MNNINTAPRKLKALLLLCLVGTVVSIGVTFLIYLISRNVVQTVGKDTVPTIVAARHIRANLANAHSNAMNAMVTKEKLGGKFWNLYRKDLNTLAGQLIDASRNITYGDEERLPLLAIQSNLSAYEYTVGGAVSGGAEISVDQFMEANRLMQQKILPASTALSKANLSKLEETYGSYTKSIDSLMVFMQVIGLAFLLILIAAQIYLFKRTHRIFNAGLLLATVLFAANLIYSTMALNSVKAGLYTAKQDAFDSLNSLWSTRAEAYNAKAIQSLYLLHNGTGIVQTADTINFNLAAGRICSDPKAALGGGNFEGYLKDAQINITFSGEQSAVTTALQQWAKYVDIDKQVRNLEYDSKHKEAIALSVGEAAGQSYNEFTKFDAALGNIININQTNFDSSIKAAFTTLNMFPWILAAFLALIAAACLFGLKPRIDEYRI